MVNIPTNQNNEFQKQAWKASPPPLGVPETKQVDSKTWHWCAH